MLVVANTKVIYWSARLRSRKLRPFIKRATEVARDCLEDSV